MTDFDLAAYFGEQFPGLQLDGALFYHWPLGIRFEIGRKSIPERPVSVFESAFSPNDTCVIISKDWPMIGLSPADRSRYFSLFPLFDLALRMRIP